MDRIGWLRAAVLGANDGIVSIASLVVGAAAASAVNAVFGGERSRIGCGAMLMAAGEYVSVSSQADTVQQTLPANARSWKPTQKASCAS